MLISYSGVSAMNTSPSSIRVGVSRYSIVRIRVRIWKPSTSASVQMITLFQRSRLRSKVARSLLALLLTSTPQPSTLSRSVMMSFLKILSYSALRQLRILPRTGIIA